MKVTPPNHALQRPAIASRLQSLRPAGRVAELGSLGRLGHATAMRALSISFAVALAASLASCAWRQEIKDYSSEQPSTCELHGAAMTKRRVTLAYGGLLPTEKYLARQQLFPHADEPYESGYCAPPPQGYARVHVCSRCTEARTKWLETQKTEQ